MLGLFVRELERLRDPPLADTFVKIKPVNGEVDKLVELKSAQPLYDQPYRAWCD